MSKKRVVELGPLPIIPKVFNNVQTERNQNKASVPESHLIDFFNRQWWLFKGVFTTCEVWLEDKISRLY